MIKLEKDGYVFSVDKEKTVKYYKTHSLCSCDGCKNFRAQIGGMFPELERFLAEFGVDIRRPDEAVWFENADDETVKYYIYYTVCGNIDRAVEDKLAFGDLHVVFSRSGSPYTDIPCEQTGPYFIIDVFDLTLPWVLDTPFPAKPRKKSLFSRMRDRFGRK